MNVTEQDLIFACGCSLAAKLAYGYSRRLVAGEDVCPEHGSPVPGWASRRARERDRIDRHPAVESEAEIVDPVTVQQLATAGLAVIEAVSDYINPDLDKALNELDALVQRVLP